jgi:hypothetical protein
MQEYPRSIGDVSEVSSIQLCRMNVVARCLITIISNKL